MKDENVEDGDEQPEVGSDDPIEELEQAVDAWRREHDDEES
jgi:hypothetical protein